VVGLNTLLQKIVGGGTPSREVKEYWNGGIPWATVKDLVSLRLNDTIESISSKGLKGSASNLIPSNTIVISIRMALGKIVLFSKDVAINQDLKALYVNELVDKWYLIYWYLTKAKESA